MKNIDQIISNLTIEEKVSQLFITGYAGNEPDDILVNWVQNGLGGIIFFRDNITSPDQIAKTIEKLQNHSEIKLFTSIDQEGGLVERINRATQVPSPMALAAINTDESIIIANRILATELKAMGFNLNYTPVVDVNTEPRNPVIGIRSYGDNPDKVANYGVNVIETYRKHGIIPVAKHFPGHGASTIDSHYNLPVIDISLDELETVHLKPFHKAINNNVEMIMICHACFTALSEANNLPASLSKLVITDLLINKLSYKGVVITDDLHMQAVADRYSIEEVAEMALNAGVDILLYRNHDKARVAFEYILKKANANADFVKRIELSLRKILKLKAQYGLIDKGFEAGNHAINSIINCSVNKQEATKLFEQSITVYKQPENFTGIDLSEKILLLHASRDNLHHYYAEDNTIFSRLIAGVDVFKFSINPDDNEINKVLNLTNKYETIIVITYNAYFNPQQAKMINQMADIKYIYMLAAGSPYDVTIIKQPEYIAMSYGYRDNSLQAFVKLLNKIITGNRNFPINIPL